jgi:hypothetical protein
MTDRPREITKEEEDAAKRLMDAVNIHVEASRASGREKPGWVAIRLADGTSPTGDLYDTQKDAARHNQYDSNVFFLKVGKAHIGFREALVVLQLNRQARKNNVVFHHETVVSPQLNEMLQKMIPRTMRGLGNDG